MSAATQITWDKAPAQGPQVKWDDEELTPPGIKKPDDPILRDAKDPRKAAYQGGAPGAFEGHPENIGEWVPQGPGEVIGGVNDIAHGKFARGGHRVISGAMATAMPAAALTAPAYPAVAARGLVGGYLGGKIGATGADLFGANEEQKQFAGDIGNVVGGGAANSSRLGKSALALVKPTGKMALDVASDIPVVRGVVKGAKNFQDVPGKLRDIWTPEQAPRPVSTEGRVSLADRAGIEAGRPEPNIQISNPPEPIARRVRPEAAQPPVQVAAPAPTEYAPVSNSAYPEGLPKRSQFRSVADDREDLSLKNAMEEDLNRQGRIGRGEERRAFADANSMDKPKWLRTAEAQAEQARQKILADAEARAKTPTKFTTTKPLGKSQVATPDELLEETLRRSIDQAKARKK